MLDSQLGSVQAAALPLQSIILTDSLSSSAHKQSRLGANTPGQKWESKKPRIAAVEEYL